MTDTNITTSITLVATNGAPLLGDLQPILLSDTAEQDHFSGSAGGLVASDPDGDPLRYGLEGADSVTAYHDGIDYDLRRIGSYGTLYLNSRTGQYRFQPRSDWSLNALAASDSESFVLSVSDGSHITSTSLVVSFNASDEGPEQYVVIDEGAASLSPDAQTLWEDALSSASRHLEQLLSDPDRDTLLADVFGRAGTDAETFEANKQALLELISGSGLKIEIELRSNAELNGAAAAYAAVGHTGSERIYVNADLINDGALSLELLTSALLEEYGHALDRRLNLGVDSPGDEGQLFASEVTGVTLTPEQRAVIDAEDDSATLMIEGVQVLVEEAAVTYQALTTTDTLASTNNDTNTIKFTAQNQINSGDKFDGGPNTDTILVSSTTGLGLDFSNLDSSGLTGFLNIENLNFDNTSGTSSATFSAAQFGTGKIAPSLSVLATTNATAVQSITINISTDSSFNASGFTFTNWSGTTDKMNLIGSSGNEQITGTTQSDSITGGAGNDTIDGGTGDDTMTGGAGADTFIISASGGSSDAPTATSLGSPGSNIAAGSTLTFGNGVDIITDFVWGTDLLRSSNGSPASLGLVSLLGSSNTLDLISGVGYYAYGSWSGSVFTISTEWSAQNNDLLYVVGDAGALTPANSTGYTILTDLSTGIPAAPSTTAAITGATDNVTPSTGAISSGGTTNDPTPTFSGTLSTSLASGETLLLLNNNSSILGTASATGTNWSFTPSAALAPGSYSITAVIQDTNGNLSAAGTPFTFTLDITNVAPSVTSYSPSASSGSRSAMIVLTFNENIFANGGTVTLQSNASEFWTATLTSGQTSGTFTGTSFSGNWYIVKNQLIFDNTGGQYTSKLDYNIDISYGAVINSQGVPNLAVISTNNSTTAPAQGTGIYFVMSSAQDSTAPTFAATSWAASATWTSITDTNLSVGESIDLNLAFNEIIYVTSANTRINFTNGGYATYLSGAGSSTLKFR